MSNFDKLIKQATKPKPGSPKAKYIDPIIASSFGQDGSLQDICRALSGRLSDPSSLVVFKSLIVIHTLIRNGGVDNVLNHLASNQGSLKLRNVVAGGNWQGYDAPKMLAHYAAYIEERIKAYKELRRDCIRSSDSGRGGASEGAGSGHRLRRLTVDKGLLREVSIAQKVCSRLLDLFFSYFSDNTQDEMALTAFRMALKDLLALYAAINEGVINILEHYFEMSKPDAERALDTYKRFCSHTEKIVAYLASAKKVSYSLNVPIPNLKHAPVSLAGALKDYLEDPNFEQNRIEYKENKRIADAGGTPKPRASATEPKKEEAKKAITIQEPTSEEKAKPVKPPTSNQALQDFFESIETDQMSMFSGAPQAPFTTGMPQMMAPQATGYNPFVNGGGYMAPQQTGFASQQMGFMPQQTGFMPQQTGFMPQQTGFMQPQQTGFGAQQGFLQPQMTGFNPFRQSVMMQPTGMGGSAPRSASSPVPSSSLNASGSAAQSTGPSASQAAPAPTAPPVGLQAPTAKPLSTQKTGSRNPFAPPPGETPPPTPPPAGPRGPTLRDLAMGGAGSSQGPSMGGGGNYGLGASAWPANDADRKGAQLMPQQTGLIGSVASEFVKGPTSSSANGTASPAPTPSSSDLSPAFTSMSVASSQPSTSQATLQPQATGFGGSLVRPFQPSSTFGASLTANGGALSPPASAQSPSMSGNPFASMGTQPGAPFSNGNPAFTNGTSNSAPPASPLPAQPTSSAQSSGWGLSSQPTGFGSSLFSPATSNGGSVSSPLASQSTGLGGSTVKPFQPTSAFGSSAFSGAPSSQPPPQTNTNAFSGSLF